MNQTGENKPDSRRQLAGSEARLSCAFLTGLSWDFILEGSRATLDVICELPAWSLVFDHCEVKSPLVSLSFCDKAISLD